MAPTVAADTVVLKHCSGGGSDAISLSKTGTGTVYETLLGETAITVTRDCALRVAFEQARSGDSSNAQRAAVLRDGVMLQEWSTTSTSWTARSLDVTLTAGQTLCIRLGATGRTSNDGSTFTSQSLIRYVRYLADQRSLIGI
jgi:hypothetical protein